ncbi:DUF2306 domain-containing protein [Sulfitobacter sp. JB4-11]|uniref:DUF2306 domain-containing protein n=1 Tax=Sulfitobacter rhodophyticola TaxID=3238304 RepID=UPI0035140E32
MSCFRFGRWRIGMWSVWSLLAIICLAYGAFAISAGFSLTETEKVRALPIAFQLHALAGGVVLIVGIFQFNPSIKTRWVWMHRWGGQIYVVSALVASIAAVINAAFFNVNWTARLSFSLLGITWFLATANAYRLIRKRKFAQHREWMLRSFSLSLFFVSFSIWVPAMVVRGLGQDAAYVIAVTLSWVFNLLGAEAWIRLTRKRTRVPTISKMPT